MGTLSRRSFIGSLGMTIAAGGLEGMSLNEAMAQPLEKLAENVPTKILGRTGWKAKRLAFGTMLLRSGNKPIEESNRVCETAIELGINVFETGRPYGDCEDRVSGIVSKYRDKIFLSSKCHKKTKDGVLRDIEMSLTTLKTDYLDAYQMHDTSSLIEFETAMADNAAMDALRQAKKEGKIRFIGITSHSIPTAMTAMRQGEFDLCVLPYNAMSREFDRALNLAAKLNIGVLCMKPLGGTANLLKYNPKAPTQLPEALTLDECLKFVLSHPGITAAIPGMTSIEEVKQCVAIAATFKPLTQVEKKDIAARADRIAGGTCGQCKGKPCEKICPNKVPISFLVSRNAHLNRFWYDYRWQGEQYQVLAHDYLDCDGCGECEKVCPKKFEIRKDMKSVHQSISEGRMRFTMMFDLLK
jgi:uncharacterized protein